MQKNNKHQLIEFYGFGSNANNIQLEREFNRPHMIPQLMEFNQSLKNDYEQKVIMYKQQKEYELATELQQHIARIEQTEKDILLATEIFDNAIVVPGNWDILLNQHSLERNANELYTQNKSKNLLT